MKKAVTLLVILIWACTARTAQAQVVDTAAVQDTVVAGTEDIVFLETVPVAGNAALNRLLGTVVSLPRWPKHFLEMEVMAGFGRTATSGWGLHYAYADRHWGAYGEALLAFEQWQDRWGEPYSTCTGQGALGLVYRPVTDPQTSLDWQLYAGPSFGGLGLGYQVGTRFGLGAKENTSDFGWLTATLAMTHTTQGVYFTFGFSIELMLLVGWIFL